jgi:ParB-like chromosome segregation protein Spo0J
VLDLTKQIDQEMEKRAAQAQQLVEAMTKSPDITEAMSENIGAVDEFFMKALNDAMDSARKAGDLDKIGKLQKIVDVVQEANKPPEEVAFIEELVNTENDAEMMKKLEEHKDKINAEFLEVVSTLIAQAESGDENKEFLGKLNEIYKLALGMSMRANL